MTDTAVAADLGQALDVQSHFTAEVALNGEVLVDHITQLCFLLVGQVLDAGVRIDLSELEDLVCACSADAVDISQTDFDSLLTGQVNTSNTCHTIQSTSY